MTFEFQVLAETGTNFTRFEDFVSLNDSGKVSFIAHDGQGASGVYVGEAQTVPKLVTFSADRNFGRASSINDEPLLGQHKVAARDLNFNNSHSYVRQWSTTSSQPTPDMVAVSKDVPLSLKEPERFDSFSSFLDINDLNQVVFVGLDSTTGSTVQKLRIRDSVVNAAHGWSIEVGDFPSSAAMRPQISNTTEVVFRSPLGATIYKTDRNAGRFRTIAGTKEGFIDVGRSPGISDDGRAIVFYGDHPFDNQPNDGLGGGPGIFVSLLKPGGDPNGGSASRMLVRLAGLPKELGLDPFGNPLSLTQFATHSSVTGNTTTDSRVGISGTLSLENDSYSLFYVTFLANDPRNGNRETLWRVEFTALVNGLGELTVSLSKPQAVTSVGKDMVDKSGRPVGKVSDLELYDPINNKGQIAFWAKLDGGAHAIVVASKLKNPVLLVPGIVGTFADTDFKHWLMNRGESPANLKIDPLGRFYDNLIATLKRAGYKEGEDLFIATYDWRVLPGPIDAANLDANPANWNFDGQLPAIKQRISSSKLEYGVDYFLHWLKTAVNAWETKHPGLPLDAVDVIAHSTGGLVARSYIQSDAYGASYQAPFGRMVELPMVDKFVMVGVPNRGATKAWNPLKDNFKNDPAFRFLLSKVIKDAFIKQKKTPIRNPDGTQIFQETDPVAFIQRYIPTIGSLLATYKFLLNNGQLESVNDKPHERNNLLLDLNAGLDLAPNGDPHRFADLVGQVVNVFGTNAPDTPFTVREHVGPVAHLPDPLYPFNNLVQAQEPGASQVWWEDQPSSNNGDGTVPLLSTRDQFAGDARIKQLPFTTGTQLSKDVNTLGKVGHTELLSNPDVQAAILAQLGQPIARSRISTTINIPAGGNFKHILLDPVEGFVVDGQGRRLGYTTATGIVEEIPNSVYIGGQDGMGWIFGPVVAPLTLQLTGVGEDHYAEVSGVEGVTPFGVSSEGFLAGGEQRNITVVTSINYPPDARDDYFETTTPLVLDVLSNDSDPNGDTLQLLALNTFDTSGRAEITVDQKVHYTPRAGMDGLDSFTYTVGDGKGGQSTGRVTIAVPGRPRILNITPGQNAEVGNVTEITIEFSHPMHVPSVTDVKNYQVIHESLGPIPIAVVRELDINDVYIVGVELAPTILPPGRVHIHVNGEALRTANGQPINGARHSLRVITPDDNGQAIIRQTAGGGPALSQGPTIPGQDMPLQVQLVDYNQDKIVDIVAVSPASSEIMFYTGRGDETYEPPSRLKLPPMTATLGAQPLQVYVADWNGDRIPDLLVYDQVDDYWQGNFKRIHIYLNDGYGNVTVAPDTPFMLNLNEGQILAVADFTGDGLADVAVTGPPLDVVNGSLSIYGKDPFLGITRSHVLPTERKWFPVSGVTGDFNGDGKLDLIVATTGHFSQSPGVLAYFGTPTGLGPAQHIDFPHVSGVNLAAGDFTGDGKLDLAVVHDFYSNLFGVNDGAVISLLENDGSGNFTELTRKILGRRGISLIGASDLNRDGKQDLALLAPPWDGVFDGFPNLENYSTWSWLGDGRGDFAPLTADPISVAPPNSFNSIFVAGGDLNGDGHGDSMISGDTTPIIFVQRNDGAGGLRDSSKHVLTGVLLAKHPDAERRKLADVNGDGRLDLLTMSGVWGKQLNVYLATADGGFVPHDVMALPGGTWFGWIQVADMNGDGSLDAVIASDGGGLVVLLGQGDGRFVATTAAPIPADDFTPLNDRDPGAIVDVNRDGKLDVLVMVKGGWAVYFGDGTGKLTFNRNTFLAFPEGFDIPPYNVPLWHPDYTPAVHDFDGDGKVDLLVSTVVPDGTSSRMIVYRGVGNGTFTPGPVTPLPFAFPMFGHVVRDFNGDGNLDTVGYTGSGAELFLGDGTGRFQHLPGAVQTLNDFVGYIVQQNAHVLTSLVAGDFNGDGTLDLAATRSSGFFHERQDIPKEVAIFYNDRTGRFGAPFRLPTTAEPRTLQPVPENRWTLAGEFIVTASLWPVKVTSPQQLPNNNPEMTGVGPPEATVRLMEGTVELKRAAIDSEGRWSVTLPSGMSVGKHILSLVAVDIEGRLSAETKTTVDILPAARPWQNPRNTLDINDDGNVTNFDLVLILRELGTKGSYRLPIPTSTVRPPPFYDAFPDDLLTVSDALAVLRFLGQRVGSSEPQGERAPVAEQANRTATGTAMALDPNAVDAAFLDYFGTSSGRRRARFWR